MKVFLSKVACFIFIWIAIYSILYFTISRSLYATTDYIFSKAVFGKIDSGNIHTNILIGDSKPQMCINAKMLHAINLSVGGTCPVEGYYITRQLLQNKTNKIDTIFISYSLRHLIKQENFYWGTYKNNSINYRYLDSVYDIAMKYHDDSYALANSIYPRLYDRIINKPSISAKIRSVQDFIMSGTLNIIYENLQKAYNNASVNGNGQFINGRIIVMPSDTTHFVRPKNLKTTYEDLIDPKQSIVNKIFLQNILEMAKAHHAKVIYILMPSEKLTISDALKQEKINLVTTFGNNLLIDTSAYAEQRYFRDNYGHLNRDGIKKFQNFLQNRLYALPKTNQIANKNAEPGYNVPGKSN